jgi:hypothetical protein
MTMPGSPGSDSTSSRIEQIDKTRRNLLDNITKANRDLVDQRLEELTKERERLETRIDSTDHLVLSEAEMRDLVAETARFVATLGPSLREGPLDERHAAVHRCADEILIEPDKGEARTAVRVLPTMAGGPSTEVESVIVKLPKAKRGRPKGRRSGRRRGR